MNKATWYLSEIIYFCMVTSTVFTSRMRCVSRELIFASGRTLVRNGSEQGTDLGP